VSPGYGPGGSYREPFVAGTSDPSMFSSAPLSRPLSLGPPTNPLRLRPKFRSPERAPSGGASSVWWHIQQNLSVSSLLIGCGGG